MFDALYISATGMQAQQTHLESIANNLANMNTPAFKRNQVSFTDLVVREAARLPAAAAPSGLGADGDLLAPVQRAGAGVGIAAMAKLFDMGELKKTDSPYDIAIQGEGFVEVRLADGTSAFSRGGTLRVNRDGLLATQAGLPLKGNIAVPDNTQSLLVATDGQVQALVAGQSAPVDLGRIELVRFTSPQALSAQGDGLYRASAASGEAIAAHAGEDGMGSFAQGFLEGSNVKLSEEMVGLMLAQRVYEANVKVIQAADEMLGMVNQMRK